MHGTCDVWGGGAQRLFQRASCTVPRGTLRRPAVGFHHGGSMLRI